MSQADDAAKAMGWAAPTPSAGGGRWQDAPLVQDDLPPLVPLSSLKRDVVSVPKGEPRNLSDVKPGELRVTIPAGTHQGTPTAPSSGTELPPEADLLFNKVRRAEGTASGSGFVYYGGEAFSPGREHPGAAARRPGPKGPTSAAGPGQWEEKTWNGLKPEFRSRFGRNPDFSDADDQKRMTWLNGANAYPGGEARLRDDIKAGKLNTDALAYQWTGFAPDRAGGGNWNIIGAGKWNVSSDALRHGTSIPDAAVQWVDPQDYLYLLPPLEGDAANKSKRQSLAPSGNAGEEIQDLPSL